MSPIAYDADDHVAILARSLNLKVTAEGIETSEQWQQLRDLACDQGHGYYFARPQPSVGAALFRAAQAERAEPHSTAA
jgi:EAL domain-containing protein (putative c-di-GMP-specific phosphodiesterase class I)